MPQDGTHQEALNAALHQAIEADSIEGVRDALSKGADLNAKQGRETPLDRATFNRDAIRTELILAGAWQPGLLGSLTWAVGTGNVDLVRLLIDRGADVNVHPPLGTPLRVAALHGRSEMVEILIAAKADLDTGSISDTPLSSAIEGGHEDVALRLLEAGAKPEVTPLGFSPLARSAGAGMGRVVGWLIDRGIDLEEVASHVMLNQAEVQQTAADGLSQAFKALKTIGETLEAVENGEDVDLADVLESTGRIPERRTLPKPIVLREVRALHLAAFQGHHEIVDRLLSSGANADAREAEGRTAWELANEAQWENVLEVLAKHGIEGRSSSPNMALLEAAERGDVEALRQALKAGAETSARDERKATRSFTPLLLASHHGHREVVAALLDAGADPNLSEERSEISNMLRNNLDHESLAMFGVSAGRTALIEASRGGHTAIVERLLAAGADAAVVDLLDDTALIVACESGEFRVLPPLLAARPQPTPDGAVALRVAIRERNSAMIDALLAAGVDIAAKNSGGENALTVASEQADAALIRRLLVLGADVNTRTKDGGTPLTLATEASHWVESGDDDKEPGGIRHFDLGDSVSKTLESYPEEEILEAVNALLEAGADPDPKNVDESPLACAARTGYLTVMEALIAAGATTDRDAFENAKLYGRNEAQRLLLKHGSPPPEDEDENGDVDTWGPELPRPELSDAASDAEYQAAVEALAERYEAQAVPLEGVVGHFQLHINATHAQDFEIEPVRKEWLERGAFVYLAKSNFGRGGQKIRILPTTDPYEAIAVEQTNGANYDIGPGYVVEWMKRLEAEQPFVIHRIVRDTLAGRFLQPVENAEELAERIYEFCPDTVDQGFDEVEALAENLDQEGTFYFWWD